MIVGITAVVVILIIVIVAVLVVCLMKKAGKTAGANAYVHNHYQLKVIFNHLTPTVVAIWVHAAIKHSVPDLVKPSFVIFDIRAP